MTTYFDVTDIIEYAKGNSRVSGIQRVQLRVISELAKSSESSSIRVIHYNEEFNRHFTLDPGIVFESGVDEFNPKRVLQSLGVTKPGRFPEKYQIRSFLKAYDHNKLLRGMVKAELYLMAFFHPRKLLDLGLHEWRTIDASIPRSPTQAVVLKPTDQLALLGAFWEFDNVIAFAKQHRKQGGRVAVLVHDVIPHVAPELCSEGQIKQFWPRFKHLDEYANRFLAVSQHTAADFSRSLPATVKHGPVHITPLAHEFSKIPRINGAGFSTPITKPYILCVGTIEIRKNGAMLLKAWQKLIRELGDEIPDLVFCGKYGWKISEFKFLLATNAKLRQHIKVVNSPSDSALAKLIQGALFLVFPSYYEGWGLPVGEAAWLGKFTLASRSSSIPEVMGDLIDYADPDDLGSWTSKIRELITHPEKLAAFEENIKAAQLRSWSDTARAMLTAIRSDII